MDGYFPEDQTTAKSGSSSDETSPDDSPGLTKAEPVIEINSDNSPEDTEASSAPLEVAQDPQNREQDPSSGSGENPEEAMANWLDAETNDIFRDPLGM